MLLCILFGSRYIFCMWSYPEQYVVGDPAGQKLKKSKKKKMSPTYTKILNHFLYLNCLKPVVSSHVRLAKVDFMTGFHGNLPFST